MSSKNDSISKTVTVALLLCLVCSIVVSGAAVIFKPTQEFNKALDKKANILAAAGIDIAGKDINALFEDIEIKLVDLESGQYVEDMNAEKYDQLKAAKDPELSASLASDVDIAGINRLEKYAPVYLLKENGQLKTVILPIRGYGLWGTLYGFLALEKDANTVVGITFYQHKETPGLGGEVDNPRWKAIWPGKQVYGANGEPMIDLVKGNVSAGDANAEHKVDALSGATLTSNGVENLVRFWLDEKGFGPYLANLKAGEI